MGNKSDYADILKRGNFKFTKQRYAILGIMDNSSFPISAEELYVRLKEENVGISLSTVYRTLEAFHEKGIIVRSNLPDENKAVFKLFSNEHHHHLLCVECRKIFPVEGCPLKEYEKFIEKQFGFTVKGHNLEVYGCCNNCTAKD